MLKGFIVGLALTIIIGQVPKLLGVPKTSGDFFEQTWGVITQLGDVDGLTVLIGGSASPSSWCCGGWCQWCRGRSSWCCSPSPSRGVPAGCCGVDIVGQIEAGLPAVGLPDVVGLDRYLDLVGPAVGVLLIGFAEGLGAAKTYAARAGYEVSREPGAAPASARPTSELGCARGMVVNGSLSKTAVNGAAGAKTQVSGLVVAVLTVLTLLFLTGLFEQLPEATLAAVVIAAVVELVDVSSLRRLYRVWTARLGSIYGFAARADFVAAIAAMLGVLIFDTLPGLFIGIAVSMLLLLYRVSRPARREAGQVRGSLAGRGSPPRAPSGGGQCCRSGRGRAVLRQQRRCPGAIERLCTPETRVVVLDAETSPFIDITAARCSSSWRPRCARTGSSCASPATSASSGRHPYRRAGGVPAQRVPHRRRGTPGRPAAGWRNDAALIDQRGLVGHKATPDRVRAGQGPLCGVWQVKIRTFVG